MEYLKKRLLILCLSVVFSAGWNTAVASTTNHIILTSENIEQLTDSLAAIYDPGHDVQYRARLFNYFSAQLVGQVLSTSLCSPIFPHIADARFGEYITFKWEAALNLNTQYNIYSFNLRNTDTDERTTNRPGITFEPITDDFYVFSFKVKCNPGSESNSVIIIADKDIFLQGPPEAAPDKEEPTATESRAATGLSSTPTITQLQIAPNPFQEAVRINFYATITEQVTISLYDFNGRILRRINKTVEPGLQEFTIAGSELPQGFYTLFVKSKAQNSQRKLVRIN